MKRGCADTTEPLLQNNAAAEKPHVVPFALFFVLGISTWATVNFLFSELPLLTQRGGGWAVSADISLVIQCANALPLTHVALSRLLPRSALLSPCGRSASVAFSTALNCIAAALIAADPWPTSRFALLVMSCLAGAAATLSAVAHYPFAADYPPCYTSALAAGTSAGAMLAGILALVQQPGTANIFSMRVFMSCSFVLGILGAVSFVLLLFLPSCRSLRNVSRHARRIESLPNIVASSSSSPSTPLSINEQSRSNASAKPWFGVVLWPTILLAWLSLVENGLCTGVVTYALLPFGCTALVTATAVAFFVDPLVSALPGVWLQLATALDSHIARSLLAAMFTVPCGVMLWYAFESPTPPLVGAIAGAAIICSMRIAVRGFTAICKVACWMVVHGHGSGHIIPIEQRVTVSQVGGLSVQIGSFIGAMTIFLIVHFTDWFHTASSSASSSSSSS